MYSFKLLGNHDDFVWTSMRTSMPLHPLTHTLIAIVIYALICFSTTKSSWLPSSLKLNFAKTGGEDNDREP